MLRSEGGEKLANRMNRMRFTSGYGFSVEDFPDVFDAMLDEIEKKVDSLEALQNIHAMMARERGYYLPC